MEHQEMGKILVVAKNHDQFTQAFGNDPKFVYLPSNMPEKIRGFRDCKVMYIGDYWRRKDLDELEQELNAQNITRI